MKYNYIIVKYNYYELNKENLIKLIYEKSVNNEISTLIHLNKI